MEVAFAKKNGKTKQNPKKNSRCSLEKEGLDDAGSITSDVRLLL